METTILFYALEDNGKENGNYYGIFEFRVQGSRYNSVREVSLKSWGDRTETLVRVTVEAAVL